MLTELLYGARNTILIVTAAWSIGLPFGILISFVSLLSPDLRKFFRVAAVILSILPLLVILFWLHYPLQTILNVVIPPIYTSIVLLIVYVTLISGDILAEQMLSMRENLFEAALVLGIPEAIFTKKILFSASLQNSLSRLLTLAVGTVHITMFMSLIGVEELFRVSQRLSSQLSKPIEVYTAMAITYAILCAPLYVFGLFFRRRINKRHA